MVTITINRPEKKNAIDLDTMFELPNPLRTF